MVVLLVCCVILAVLLGFAITRCIRAEHELLRMKEEGKILGASYTVTESDYARYKEKKIPKRVREILSEELRDDIVSHFPHMPADEVNGYRRYTYRFRIIPENNKSE